jgi:hypothetical protein
MGNKFSKLIGSNSATVFLFLYGLIVQIVALPIICFFISNYPVKTSVVEASVFIWFCIPIISVFSVIIAIIQIRKRKRKKENYKTPLVGLILNLVWLLCYLFAVYMIFIVGTPFLLTK